MYLRLSKSVCILLKKTSLLFYDFSAYFTFLLLVNHKVWNQTQISYWKWITTFKISMFRTVSSVSIYHEHWDCTTNRLHYKQTALQTDCTTNRLHHKQTALQTDCTTNRLHYKQTALQTDCTTNRLHYKQIIPQDDESKNKIIKVIQILLSKAH